MGNQGWTQNGMMGFGDSGLHWLMGGQSGLLLLLLLIVTLIGAYLLLRDERRNSAEDSALDLLASRYANGDIDRDEYLEKRKEIAR